MSYMIDIEVVGPQNHFRTDPTSLWSIWNEFGRFEFLLQKINFFRISHALQAILKHFWRILLMWIRKIQFFQKVMTISKIWPERFQIWTHWSSSFKGLIIAAKLRLTKFEDSSSKSGFHAPKQLQAVWSAKEWYLWPILTFWKIF